MSSREPLWYCHECHAEMRPLMVPDPHCASCRGTFVEKLENPADDPREYAHGLGEEDDPFGPEGFLVGLQNLLRAGAGPPVQGRSPPLGGRTSISSVNGNSGFTIHINRSSNPGEGLRTTGPARTGDIPLFSDYVSRNTAPRPSGRDTIDGALMFQYLLTMLHNPTRNGAVPDMFEGLMAPGAEPGRFGDYVFSQEALDQIMTQLMENSQAHPVPASEEIMQKLPREVLVEGSPLLEKDCAVCKEQFQLETEDPDEQVVVTLPCKHPFHEPCIIPWLKSSGTCPVCRYQLVPQPSHGSSGPGPQGNSTSANNDNNGRPGASNRSTSPSRGQDSAGGLFGSLFNILQSATSGAGAGSGQGSASSTQSQSNQQSSWRASRPDSPRGTQDSRRSPQRRDSDHEHDLPGSWNDVD